MANILIIDDTASVRHLVRAILQRQGHTVSEARDGTSGLEQATTYAPDLLILDVGLPDMSGIDVATTLRANPLLRDLPILMLTGLNSTDNVIAGLQVADDYVTKPFEKRELLARVDVLLRRHHDDQRLKGRLEHVGGAATLLQTVAKSGDGGLVFADGSIVYFEKGFVVHAERNKVHTISNIETSNIETSSIESSSTHSYEHDKVMPMEVLRGIFNREEGAFHFDPSLRPIANSMAREPTALLLEAASHYDEINRNDVVSTLTTSERLIADQDEVYRDEVYRDEVYRQDVGQRQTLRGKQTLSTQPTAPSQPTASPQDTPQNAQNVTTQPISQQTTRQTTQRKPRHIDISNLTLSSLAVVDSLTDALSYIEGLHGKQPFRVSEHIDPDTNAPYLLFDSGDVKIVAQRSQLSSISAEISDVLRLELIE